MAENSPTGEILVAHRVLLVDLGLVGMGLRPEDEEIMYYTQDIEHGIRMALQITRHCRAGGAFSEDLGRERSGVSYYQYQVTYGIRVDQVGTRDSACCDWLLLVLVLQLGCDASHSLHQYRN